MGEASTSKHLRKLWILGHSTCPSCASQTWGILDWDGIRHLTEKLEFDVARFSFFKSAMLRTLRKESGVAIWRKRPWKRHAAAARIR